MTGQDEEGSIETIWAGMRASIEEAARVAVGVRPRTRRKEWFDEECASALAKRHEARLMTQQRQTRRSKQVVDSVYADERKKTRPLFKKKKRAFRDQQLQALQDYYRADEARKLYKSVNVERRGYQPRLGMCKDQQGVLLTSKEAISNRWAEYFESLLNPSQDAEPPSSEPVSLEAESEGIPLPTFEET